MIEIKSNRAWREECESLRQQLASRDAEAAELNRKVFALKTPCVVALAALEDFNEHANGQRIFIPAEIDFAIDRLKEVLK